MKIVTIIGARPQFIKAATISHEIKKYNDLTEIIVHTGQHFDANMSDVFFEQMSIPRPNYQLKVSGLTHGAMTGRMLEQIEDILITEQPDFVLVYGDTNSTLAGAIAASKLNIKVAHVEAGLRSNNMKMPEEQNRILTDRISTLLFCPTKNAVDNLALEGYDEIKCEVMQVGDVMQDAVRLYSKYSQKPDSIPESFVENGFVLSTVHRAENTNDVGRLKEIIQAINAINERKNVLLPLHPRTRNILIEHGIHVNAKIIEPVGYLEMLYLLEKCSLVLCDSGGLQKEAYFFTKPCITMRDETEWKELLDVGANFLAGADSEKILSLFEHCVNLKISDDGSLYGGGYAAERIIKRILSFQDSQTLL